MATAKPEKKAFKDWFDRAAAKALAAQVRGAWPGFDDKAFIRRATKGLADLEMSGRVQQFSDALRAGLPESVPKALGILVDGLPPLLPDAEAVTDGWLQWPVGQFIADHGVPHFEDSMRAMTELTQRFSSEFAVRPFVEQRPEETFERLGSLTSHPSQHVRRWCSEGVRPRLPWGRVLKALVADPTPIWPILDALQDDPERYVQRSVANTLGDIAKDHPAAAVRWAKACVKRGGDDHLWIAKHGLRGPIKAGNKDALAAVGFKAPKNISATLRATPKAIRIGEAVELQATLTSTHARAQSLLVDYVVHYVRKAKASGGKTFKWKTVELPARGEAALKKRHNMKPTTIRALYPGKHRVELMVGGEVLAEAAFTLKDA
jgi:3-methyladenine DNA glycosylase AlkC